MSLDIYLRFNHTEHGWVGPNFLPTIRAGALSFNDYFTRDNFVDSQVRRVHKNFLKHKFNLLTTLESVSYSNDTELYSESIVDNVKNQIKVELIDEATGKFWFDLPIRAYLGRLTLEPKWYVEYLVNNGERLPNNVEKQQITETELHAVEIIDDAGFDDLTLFKLSFESPVLNMRSTKECQDKVIEFLEDEFPEEFQFIGKEHLFRGYK